MALDQHRLRACLHLALKFFAQAMDGRGIEIFSLNYLNHVAQDAILADAKPLTKRFPPGEMPAANKVIVILDGVTVNFPTAAFASNQAGEDEGATVAPVRLAPCDVAARRQRCPRR